MSAESIRNLVTVEKILDVKPIKDADAIESVTVRGWNVVVKKDEFTVGDGVLYFEIDSFLPFDDERFAFLESRGSKTVTLENGTQRTGHILRTARLRGTYSQGLVLPLSEFSELNLDGDIATQLGVFKYEPPIPAKLAGQIVGKFPTNLAPKTDAERVQNLTDVFDVLTKDEWYCTEKLHGSSVSVFNDSGAIRFCSRNWELLPREGLSSYEVDKRLGLSAALKPGEGYQAELCGPGINGNTLKLPEVTLFIFNFIRNGELMPRQEWPELFLKHAVPVLPLELLTSVSEAVSQVDGMKSSINPFSLAEGVVWHSKTGKVYDELNGRGCFKSINAKFLLKHGG